MGGFGGKGTYNTANEESNTTSGKWNYSKNTLGDSSTINPFFSSHTDNNGTTTNFTSGALKDLYNSADDNINSLLNEYLNPNLNSTTNQAKLNTFNKTLNENTTKSLENDIINPLQSRNMIRSSVANDMYNNLSKNNSDLYADYINELLSNSESQSADKINNYMNWLLQVGNLMNGNEAKSLQTSIANGSTFSNGIYGQITNNKKNAFGSEISGHYGTGN